MAAAYLTHHQKVLRLYKKSLRHIESWCIFRDKYRFYACLLRARFDENKHEKDMMKATMMLKAGEEEFWANQHPQPYLFPDSPGGTSYERYECYKASGIAHLQTAVEEGLNLPESPCLRPIQSPSQCPSAFKTDYIRKNALCREHFSQLQSGRTSVD
ncbi:NADH dehydrogenase [ubiquinone] 1 beta subcomplex subunit 9 isoform X2 [Onychostoma macrolepis]|uniref:NADH dehydrogenase [ubiquinone] 1 beta subcomplex subunit 9 isoform X2 n=1 Tax=Onychostoma macrolepis TaxID=369639 RepID=UPI00272BE017|nr:NADH dehydrogenase [ubiquinone] 1 beta subcomplex subunit 9 isoform X2 [Onychostoma macrolepis]